jgi:hypothetical protein
MPLASLSAVLPGYPNRMSPLLGQADVVNDPGCNRAAFRHRRQRIVARATQQGLVAPGGAGHRMVQPLMQNSCAATSLVFLTESGDAEGGFDGSLICRIDPSSFLQGNRSQDMGNRVSFVVEGRGQK